jgi:uncharacterized membrane protein
MKLRVIVLATAVASSLAIPPAAAQPLSGQTWAKQATATTAASANDVTLAHSVLKATTFKAATIATNIGMFSYITGGLVIGGVLTALDTAASVAIYTANDYLWDKYDPPPVKQTADQSIDKTAEAWRTTRKFLTYKPAVAAVGWGLIYAYTGSATATVVFGTASSLSKTALFYINNFAWDAYDWHEATPVAAPASASHP